LLSLLTLAEMCRLPALGADKFAQSDRGAESRLTGIM